MEHHSVSKARPDGRLTLREDTLGIDTLRPYIRFTKFNEVLRVSYNKLSPGHRHGTLQFLASLPQVTLALCAPGVECWSIRPS